MSVAREEELGSLSLLNKAPLVAGRPVTLRIVYRAGRRGIRCGGALAVFFWRGWTLGKATAYTDAPGVGLEVKTLGTNPYSGHLGHNPTVLIRVTGKALPPGKQIFLTVGDRGDLMSGFYILARAPEVIWADPYIAALVDSEGLSNYVLPEKSPRFAERTWKPLPSVLRVKMVPGPASSLRVVGDSTPKPGGFVRLRVVVLDEYENPVSNYRGKIRIECIGEPWFAPIEVKMESRDRGAKTVIIPAPPSGASRRVAAIDVENELIGRSNPICTGFLAGRERIFFGEIHYHSSLSDGQGTAEESYSWARNIAGLDFAALTDHEGGTDFEKNRAAVRRFYEPGRFVTLLGFEHSRSPSQRKGHRNVYYRDDGGRADPGGYPSGFVSEGKPGALLTPAHLWKFLKGKKALVVPHHTNTCAEIGEWAWDAYDTSSHNPRFERLLEICQCRGSFETPEPGRGVELTGFGASARELLDIGCRFGFIGGTDNHLGHPADYRDYMAGRDYHERRSAGLACVIAPQLTREAVWDALWARRCYATNGPRILLDFSLDGLPMGTERYVKRFPARRTLRYRVVGTEKLLAVELIRQGRIIASARPTKREAQGDFRDSEPLGKVTLTGGYHPGPTVYYYLRVRQADGGLAWSSPVWLTRA